MTAYRRYRYHENT